MERRLYDKRKVNIHSSGDEFYGHNHWQQIDIFDDKIYYIEDSSNPWCVSLACADVTGKNARVLNDGIEYRSYNVHTNITGIYLYSIGAYDSLHVSHYSFDGELISRIDIENEDLSFEEHDFPSVGNVYFYDNKMYLTVTRQYNGKLKTQIWCVHIDKKAYFMIYDNASEIDALFASEDKLIINATYINEAYEFCRAKGWMAIDLNTKESECVCNKYYNPEDISKGVNAGENVNIDCNRQYKGRKIEFFDLTDGIFWTSGGKEVFFDNNGQPVEFKRLTPHELWGDRDEIAEDYYNFPSWRMTESGDFNEEYFDGEFHFYMHFDIETEKYYLKSSNYRGNIFEWESCEYDDDGKPYFTVLDKYIAVGDDFPFEVIYRCDYEQPEPIGKIDRNRNAADKLIYQWSEDGYPEHCEYEVITLNKDAECYHCSKTIKAGSSAMLLTSSDGDRYILHRHCAQKSCF